MSTTTLPNLNVLYASLGFPIIPLVLNGKNPACTHGLKDGTTDPKKIASFPAGNVGIVTGKRSGRHGLTVIDIDQPALDLWHRLMSNPINYIPPYVPTVRTRSGGLHLYFAYDERMRTGSNRLAQGIDVRSDGGYVVAPPSTINGQSYTWIDERAIANPPRIPNWLASLMPARRDQCTENPPAVEIEDDLKDVEAMLSKIPNHAREDWITVGMALKSKYGDSGFDLWCKWSANGYPNYRHKEQVYNWGTFKGRGVNFGSIVFLAKKYGYSP